MTLTAQNYATDLINGKIGNDILKEVSGIMEAVPQIRMDFEDPTVSLEKKHIIIDRVFPKEIRNFLKLLCDNGDFALWDDICKYRKLASENSKEREETATLVYVTKPTDEQLAGIRRFLEKEFDNPDMDLLMEEDKSIKSGFILRIGSQEYDWSEKGRLEQLKAKVSALAENTSVSTEGIISILKAGIKDFELEAKDKEIGVVNWVGDGIANVDGIDHAFYGEIVLFDCGVKGMVQDVRRDEIGVILFGRDTEIKEGSRVVRTGKMAGISVGDALTGRVIDALGNPIDGKGEIKTESFRPMETPAPGIVDRKSVSEPLETGILAIDSMFPIGRGQRELIIGDRQTGKTSFATVEAF